MAMRRREFVVALGGVAAWPLVARAQQARRVYRLGFLAITRDLPRTWKALIDGLRAHGYVEGQNLIIEWRYSEGQAERWPELARELVGLNVDAIVVNTTPAALAAKRATSTIPIVITAAFDPVGAGLVASLAKPGGNVTGLGLLVPEVNAKALSLLKEAVSGLSRVDVLWNAMNPANTLVWKEIETTARATDIILHSQPIREPKDLDSALVGIAQDHADGLLILVDAVFVQYLKPIVEFTIRNRLPAVSRNRDFPELGTLMSYGPDRVEMYRKASDYLDRILTGAKPADLPMELPTKFELVINLKTAKALGLEIPPQLIARADEVIE
jgi:putative tryptophan/tyrosine transport system substrate-binding protein